MGSEVGTEGWGWQYQVPPPSCVPRGLGLPVASLLLSAHPLFCLRAPLVCVHFSFLEPVALPELWLITAWSPSHGNFKASDPSADSLSLCIYHAQHSRTTIWLAILNQAVWKDTDFRWLLGKGEVLGAWLWDTNLCNIRAMGEEAASIRGGVSLANILRFLPSKSAKASLPPGSLPDLPVWFRWPSFFFHGPNTFLYDSANEFDLISDRCLVTLIAGTSSPFALSSGQHSACHTWDNKCMTLSASKMPWRLGKSENASYVNWSVSSAQHSASWRWTFSTL